MENYKIEDFGKFSLDEEIEALERETRERKDNNHGDDSPKKAKASSARRGRSRDTDTGTSIRRLNINISSDLYRRLLFQSELEGTTVTALVTEILDRGVKTLQQLKADI